MPRVIALGRPAEQRFCVVHRVHTSLDPQDHMAEGTIKRLTDKGFGFIDSGDGQDIFFHMSSVVGVTYDDLREGQKGSFDEEDGPKGKRAGNVEPVD